MDGAATSKNETQVDQKSGRLIEEARKAIERVDMLVRRRILDAIRAQRKT